MKLQLLFFFSFVCLTCLACLQRIMVNHGRQPRGGKKKSRNAKKQAANPGNVPCSRKVGDQDPQPHEQDPQPYEEKKGPTRQEIRMRKKKARELALCRMEERTMKADDCEKYPLYCVQDSHLIPHETTTKDAAIETETQTEPQTEPETQTPPYDDYDDYDDYDNDEVYTIMDERGNIITIDNRCKACMRCEPPHKCAYHSYTEEFYEEHPDWLM